MSPEERRTLRSAKLHGQVFPIGGAQRAAAQRLVAAGLLTEQHGQFVPTPAGQRTDVEPRWTCCRNCGGEGWSLAGGDCPACNGLGRTRH